jgi:hypothetical protein
VSINRTRAIVLGFLALLTVGSFGASAAYGSPGPFWHHRSNSLEGEGLKIPEAKPEQFKGSGGKQILNGTIAGTAFEITSEAVQAKGIIYNNALQGQIKVLLVYHSPMLAKPEVKGCEVKIGTNNEVPTPHGHLMWKWDGTANQLKQSQSQTKLGQKVDAVFLPVELEAGATALPKGTFTSIALASCGVLNGKYEVKESQSVQLSPESLEEFKTSLGTSFPGWAKQHFWNGTEPIGVESVGLTFDSAPSTLTGSIESGIVGGQEIAIYEK